jgi:hypothetical protein
MLTNDFISVHFILTVAEWIFFMKYTTVYSKFERKEFNYYHIIWNKCQKQRQCHPIKKAENNISRHQHFFHFFGWPATLPGNVHFVVWLDCNTATLQWCECCGICMFSGQSASPPPPNIGNKVPEMVSYST